MRQAEDVARAKESEAAARREAEEIEAEFRQELADLERKNDPLTEELETVAVRPRRRDVTVDLLALGWLPWRSGAAGRAPAW
jgi:hypothetical protein